MISYPGTDALLVEAFKRGVKVIGGAPRYDKDGPGQIRRIFELAREFDTDIEMHLDVGNTPNSMDIHLVRELTDKYKRGGRVVVGHMAEVVPAASRSTHRARTGSCEQRHCRNGTSCHRSLPDGARLSSNNVLNPATPYGDCSLMRIANLYANVLQVDRPTQLGECFDMLTSSSARLLNIKNYGIAVGNPADIIIINARTPGQRSPKSHSPSQLSKMASRQLNGIRRS